METIQRKADWVSFQSEISRALLQETFSDFDVAIENLFKQYTPADVCKILSQLSYTEKAIPKNIISPIGELARLAIKLLGTDFTMGHPEFAKDLFSYDPLLLMGHEFVEDEILPDLIENIVTVVDGLSSVDRIQHTIKKETEVRPPYILLNSWLNVDTEHRRPYMVHNTRQKSEMASQAATQLVPDNPWDLYPFIDPSTQSLHDIAKTNDVAWVYNQSKQVIPTRSELVEYVKAMESYDHLKLIIPYSAEYVWICGYGEEINKIITDHSDSWMSQPFGELLHRVYHTVLTQFRRKCFNNTKLESVRVTYNIDIIVSRCIDHLIDRRLDYQARANAIFALLKTIRDLPTDTMFMVQLRLAVLHCITIVDRYHEGSTSIRPKCSIILKNALQKYKSLKFDD